MSSGDGDKPVYIGGVVDLKSFTKHEKIAGLLKSGKVGFYMQESGIFGASLNGSLESIAKAMAGTGPGEAEIGLKAPEWFTEHWDATWVKAGLSPTRINVIIDFMADDWLKDFKTMVDIAKTRGVTSLAPIFSPNGDDMSLDDFATNPAYAEIAEAALYGGALTLDPPPNYFFYRGEAYQEFSYGQLRWARENNLRSTVIMSPHGDNPDFREHAIDFVGAFEKHDALPSSWAIEIYDSDNKVGIGSAREPNSIVSVALWLAENAPVAGSE
jgi:hypothetical protein